MISNILCFSSIFALNFNVSLIFSAKCVMLLQNKMGLISQSVAWSRKCHNRDWCQKKKENTIKFVWNKLASLENYIFSKLCVTDPLTGVMCWVTSVTAKNYILKFYEKGKFQPAYFHDCFRTYKGGVAVPKPLKILAFPRLAWPPSPYNSFSIGLDTKVYEW